MAVCLLLVLGAVAPASLSLSGGISSPTLPAEGCTCHGGGKPGAVTPHLDGVPSQYEPSKVYQLNISIEGGPPIGGVNAGGFNLAATGGAFLSLNETTQVFPSGEIGHTTAGNNQRAWVVQWTAPAETDKVVDFRLLTNAVDGSASPDAPDQWNRATAQSMGPDASAPTTSTELIDGPTAFVLLAMAMLAIVVYALIPKGWSKEDFYQTIWAYLTTTDHKRVGMLYIATGFAFFFLGGIMALLIRVQLAFPENDFLSPSQYNQAFTMHGTTMIFLAAMPIIFGFANFVVPLQIGARDLAFPRINALGYWLLPAGASIIYLGLFTGGTGDVGWTGYPPYSESPTSQSPGTQLWVMGQVLLGISSTLTGVNFIATIMTLRAPGVTLLRVPLFTWSILITVFLLLLAIPVLTIALVMLLLDRLIGTAFFDPSKGGDPVLWQHLFWYFGHPEVYIVIIPAFGVVSEVTATMARRPIFGYRSMVYALVGLGALSYIVWGHHMFTSGANPLFRFLVMFTTMLVAVPTGIKIFNWLATLTGGALVLNTALLFSVGFIATFTMGGISGMFLASIPIDLHFHDTYFVVAHFHYVLFGGTIFAFLSAVYYWYPKITGHFLNERIGLVHFLGTFVGFNVTFYPMHELGLLGMPRRTAFYVAGRGLEFDNLLATVGAFILAVSSALLAVNIVYSRRNRVQAKDDAWESGWSLEWVTSSPPPEHSFLKIPTLLVQSEVEPLPEEQGSPEANPAIGSGLTAAALPKRSRRRTKGSP